MNESMKNLIERRSIRKYKAELVKKEQLDQILLAGTFAPTSMGKQSPQIVVTQDPKLVKKLSVMNAEVMNSDRDPFYGAGTLAIVFGKGRCAIQDASAVITNMLNAAHAVGVDSCWVNRAEEMFKSEEGKKLMKQWGVNEDMQGVAICIFGYRDCEYPEPAPRKDDYIIRV